MKKLKHIEVNCPVFKCDLQYIVNCDYKELNKYCEKHFQLEGDDFEWLKDSDGSAMTLGSDDGHTYRVIWLETFNMNHEKIGILAHETVHAVVRILDHKGVPYSSDNNQDETFAYLMDYFISNFIHDFKKK